MLWPNATTHNLTVTIVPLSIVPMSSTPTKVSRNLRTAAFFWLLAISLVTIGGAWKYIEWTKSPEYSLRQVIRAADSKDVAIFEKYVDIESVTEHAIDAVLETSVHYIAGGDIHTNSAIASLARGFANRTRPQLIDLTHRQLLTTIGSGTHIAVPDAKVPDDNPSPTTSDWSTLFGLRHWKAKKLYRRYELPHAFVGIKLEGDNGTRAIPIQLKMRDMERYWQIVEVSNLSELVQLYLTERGTNVATRDASFEELSVQLGDAGRWLRSEWITSPEYSLLQVKNAMDQHDAVLFERHVDIAAFVTRVIDVVVAVSIAEASESGDASDALAGAFLVGLVEVMKPALIDYVREQWLMAVEGRSTTLDANQVPRNPIEAGLKKAIDDLLVDVNFNVRKLVVDIQGQTAFLIAFIYDDKLQGDVRFEYKLRDMGGYWRVVEFSNLKDLMMAEEPNTKNRTGAD